jgi:hypothetical protein
VRKTELADRVAPFGAAGEGDMLRSGCFAAVGPGSYLALNNPLTRPSPYSAPTSMEFR